MASRVRETERKYRAEADTPPHDLTGAGPVARAVGPNRMDLDATYYDTVDLRLAHAGITLRRRTGGTDAGWHVKLPATGDSRDEIRFPLGRARAKVPADLVSLVRAYTLAAELAPVVRIVTERAEWELEDGDGATIALLADDQVTAHLPDGEVKRWREIEVEASDSAVLDAIEAVLDVERSPSASKLAQALGERADRRKRGPLRSKPTAGEVALDYLAEQVDRLRAHDTGVRLDSPDAVHQMRVASRRLRSSLRAFRRLFDAGQIAALRTELRWLGRELAPARDTEVLDASLHAELDRIPSDDVLGAVSARMTAEFGREAATARAAALSALDSDRHLALLTALAEFLADPSWTVRAGLPAKDELRKPVRKAARTLARSVAAVRDADADVQRDVALHQARKDAKKARYTAEAVLPVFGGKLDAWRKAVKRAQTALGEHQDAVVAKTTLRQLGVRAHLAGDNGFTYGVLHARQETRAEQAERDFVTRWRALRRVKGPRWLG
ncbi:MAG: CYTH and CHAD domain-containing protein [Actinomycetota bacterium]|nr:CYTH and CHAD domain-containing protein [Actinomycetota bacterium]